MPTLSQEELRLCHSGHDAGHICSSSGAVIRARVSDLRRMHQRTASVLGERTLSWVVGTSSTLLLAAIHDCVVDCNAAHPNTTSGPAWLASMTVLRSLEQECPASLLRQRAQFQANDADAFAG